jgi:UDP-N-acetylglucosamine--N-acetylmuramyl-(pentapeptide) pyrophosphoryl-undecaprenol N-acetylglucosamine transferase
MKSSGHKTPFVAIACGGTGGHLFPGLAVARELKLRGCDVALLISPKDIDQQAVKSAGDMEVITLPAVGLQNRNYLPFFASFAKSLFTSWKLFLGRRPDAVLAMGGFTSAPPVFAGKDLGAKTFLHESNTIPGKSNRFVSRFVDTAFVGFPEAASRLKSRKTVVTGTPVRPQFSPEAKIQNPESHCRQALGLTPGLPTVLVVGGSQGARGLNDLVLSALPLLKNKNWQWLHLTGKADFEKVQRAYAELGLTAIVKPFLAEMELALGAATACVSRAGASSLAEMAAMRLPSLLVPLPTAADNHQFFNASAFEKSGAARCVDQKNTAPETVANLLVELVETESVRGAIQSALAKWHVPDAADQIAEVILSALGQGAGKPVAAEPPKPPGAEYNVKVVAS